MGFEEMLIESIRKQSFEQGVEQAMEKGKYQFVAYLLTNTEHDNEKIAIIASTTVAFVKKVKAKIDRQALRTATRTAG